VKQTWDAEASFDHSHNPITNSYRIHTYLYFKFHGNLRSLRFRSLFLFSFVLLSGDIEPRSFSLHSMHSQHPLYSPSSSFSCTVWSDRYPQPRPFCLTETWIKPTTTAAELFNCAPPHYSLISTPRNGSVMAVAQLFLSAKHSHSYLPLLRFFIVWIIFCHSAAFSFEDISLQYLSSSFFVHSF